jgi:hypothetical protein
MHVEEANKHCQHAYTISFDMGLTQAEGQKLEWFKRRANTIFTITLKI